MSPKQSLLHRLVLLALLAPGLALSDDLQEWLATTPGGTLRGLDDLERTELRALFATLLRLPQQPAQGPPAPASEQLAAEAAAAGLRMSWTALEDQRIALLAEQPDRREGRGAFAFRIMGLEGTGLAPGPVPVLLQAPHRFADLNTGKITRLLFSEHPFFAAAWSTVRRDQEAADHGSTDLSRREDTALIALSRAFADLAPSGLVVQLHGFARSARLTKAGAEADLILSNGTGSPDAGLQQLFSCLREKLDALVMLYPWDVSELGATQNPVGRMLRAQAHSGFRHLELSPSLRQRLLADRRQRAVLARCLLNSS